MSKYVLGLETGIDGGSVSILNGGVLVESVSGSGNISKSEDLLSILDGLLKKNSIAKSAIGQIVISDEPGSLTGLRIGLATAKGLSDALSIPVKKISILEALAMSAGRAGKVLSAIITGKNVIYLREYLLGENQEAGPLFDGVIKAAPEEFAVRIKDSAQTAESVQFVFNEELNRRLNLNNEMAEFLRGSRLSVAKGVPAEIIARCVDN